MWPVVICVLLSGFFLAFLGKCYYSYVTFRRHALKTIKEAKVSIELKEWDVAEQKLLPIFKKRRYKRECLFMYIRILRCTGRFVEAEKYLAQVSKKNTKDPMLYLEIGHKACRHGAYKESVQAFSLVHYSLLEEQDIAQYAVALVRVGQLEIACSLLEPWVSPISPQETYVALGLIYFVLKRYEDAVDFYKRALALGPCSLEVTYNLAHAYRITKKYGQAQQLFEVLMEHACYREEALFNIGLCEQKLGRTKIALEIYQRCELWKRGDALLMKQAALAAMNQKNFELAEYCWNLSMQSSAYSGDYWCCVHYGATLCLLGRYSEAEILYLDLVAKFPEGLEVLKALAWLVGVGYSKSLNPKDGVFFAKKAVLLQQNNKTLDLLSACEARAGNFDKAYDIQIFLANIDITAKQRKRRSHIMRMLRQKLPLSDQDIVELEELLAA